MIVFVVMLRVKGEGGWFARYESTDDPLVAERTAGWLRSLGHEVEVRTEESEA